MRPVTLIGSRHNAHLHLLSRQISKAHALLISHEGKVYIRDLASRTHVYVNGQQVRESDLTDGDMLKLGSFTFQFQAAAGMKQRPRPDDTAAGQLVVEGADFPLVIDQRVMLIGRRPSCDISLVEDTCSTAHAVIFSMGGRRYVRDLGSRTGTYVNGQAVRQQELQFGDTVTIGETPLRYDATLAARGSLEVDEFEDLVGTAPLVGSGLIPKELTHEPPLESEEGEPLSISKIVPPSEHHDPLHASEADLDLDADLDNGAAAITPNDTVEINLASDDAHKEKPKKSHDLIPLAESAAEAPQMLIGDNLMAEKLSSSGTGAGMQSAAREAMELVRRAELRPTPIARPAFPPPISAAHEEPIAEPERPILDGLGAFDVEESTATEDDALTEIEPIAEEWVAATAVPDAAVVDEIVAEETVPAIAIPEDTIPEQITIPEATVAEEIAPEEFAIEEAAVEAAAPEEEQVAEEAVAEIAIPEEAIAEEITIPEATVAEEIAPEEFAIEEAAVEAAAPEEEQVAEEAVAEIAIPEEAIAEEITIPEATVAEEIAPEEFAIEEAAAEAAAPEEEQVAEEAVAEIAIPEDPAPEEIFAEETVAEEARVEEPLVDEIQLQEPGLESIGEPVAEVLTPTPVNEVEVLADLQTEEAAPPETVAEEFTPLEFGEPLSLIAEAPPVEGEPPADAESEKPRRRRGWFGWGKRREEQQASRSAFDRPRMADQFAEPHVLDETVELPLAEPFDPFTGIPAAESAAPSQDETIEVESITELPFEEEIPVETLEVEAPGMAELTVDQTAPEQLEWELPTPEAIADAVEVPTATIEPVTEEPVSVVPPIIEDSAGTAEPESELFFGDESLDEIIHVEDHRDPELLEFDHSPHATAVVAPTVAPPLPFVETVADPIVWQSADTVTSIHAESSESHSGLVIAITSAAAIAVVAEAAETITHTAEIAAPTPEPFAEPLAEVELDAPAVEQFEVVEPTEPTLESAMPLDIVEDNALDHAESQFTSAESIPADDMGLSDTSFGRQVEAFSGEAIEAPILDESVEPIAEFIPAEEYAEEPEVVTATEGLDSPSSIEIFEEVENVIPLTAEVPVEAEAQPIFAPPDIAGEETLPEFDDLEIGEHALPQAAVEEVSAESWTSNRGTGETLVEPTADLEPESYEPMRLPGMALFENRANIPDFIGGMPLQLNELPPPPPTFGRVQVSFGQDEPATPLLDDPHEPSPFERINSNESQLLGQLSFNDDTDLSPLEIEIPFEPQAEPEAETDFEVVSEADVEPEVVAETQAVDEAEVWPEPETVEEPIAELPSIVEEVPAPAPMEEAVEELPPEQPVRTLFQKKQNLSPVRRIKSPTVAPSEAAQGFGNAPAGFGQANAFGGSNAPARDAEAFSQGLSADLSSDSVFGAAVKPLPHPAVETTPSLRGKLREPHKPAIPSPTDSETVPSAMASKAGVPVRSLMRVSNVPGSLKSERAARTDPPARARNGFNAAAPSTSMSIINPHAAPNQMPLRRRGRRVGVLLLAMIILMVGSAAAIYTFMKQRVTVTGAIGFENYGKLTIAEQRNLQSQQNALMISEELRTVALNNFTHDNPRISAGYLADRLDFARNELGVRVKWLPTGTLLYTYEGTDKSDAERVRALLKGLYAMDADMISNAGKNRENIQNLRNTLDQKIKDLENKKRLRDESQKIIERQPAEDQIKALTADKEAAEKVWKQAVAAVNIADIELQRIEQASSLASTVEGTESIGATVKPDSTGDPEVDKLKSNLEQATARLNTARNTVAERAESARAALDTALEQFQQSTNVVQGIMKDNPELSAFVVAAQRLQETLQRLSGDLLDRQQKSYEHLLEEKRYLDERLASRRKELWDADKDIKRLKDDLGMRERGYNAALTNDYAKEATEIKKQMDLSLGKIERRKMEIENDPILVTLNEFTAKRQQEITASQKLLEADRKKADELTREIEKNLSPNAPSVEKLPENQRALAQQMASKMDAVSNARKVYAEALEAKNAEANLSLKVAEEQVSLNAARLEERKKAITAMNTQKMTVTELQEHETVVEQKRAAFDTMKKRETDAYNVYFEKEKAARLAAAEVTNALKTRDEFTLLTDAYFHLQGEIPTLRNQLEMKERDSGAFAYPMEPRVNEPTAAADQRLIYSLGAMAAIALVFSLLFALTGGRDVHAGYPIPRNANLFAPPEHDVDPLSGIGLLNPETLYSHDDSGPAPKKSAVA